MFLNLTLWGYGLQSPLKYMQFSVYGSGSMPLIPKDTNKPRTPLSNKPRYELNNKLDKSSKWHDEL